MALERLHSGAWTSATDDQQDAALITFTRILSSVCYRGRRTFADQSLAFPRLDLKRDGVLIDPLTIPLEIEWATITGVLGIMVKDTSLPLTQMVEGLTRLKADVVELGFDRSLLVYKTIPDHVRSLIPASWFCPEIVTQKAVLKVFG